MNVKQGKNQDHLQHMNRSVIMRLLHQMRICSRADLAKKSGLTQASVTGITQYLIDIGVVKEIGLIEGKKRRRSIGLTLCLDKYLCLGIRLTRKHICGGLFDIAGELYSEEERAIPSGSSPRDAIAQIKEIITILIGKADERRILGIGIALPGPLSVDENRIVYMSAFPGWENVAIKEELEEAFCLPVRLAHDGVCFALSEWWNRSDENFRLMLGILVGQGVGAGIVEDGRAITGASGYAGEIGHMSIDPDGPKCDCGNRGCLEMYTSTLSLERSMAEALETCPEHPLHGMKLDYHDILRLIDRGDPLATDLYIRSARYLGYGIVNLINFLNPDIVVVSDEMAEHTELFTRILSETLDERLSPEIRKHTTLAVKRGSRHLTMQASTSLIVDAFLERPYTAGGINSCFQPHGEEKIN